LSVVQLMPLVTGQAQLLSLYVYFVSYIYAEFIDQLIYI